MQPFSLAAMHPHPATVRNATPDDAEALAAFNRNMALETENLALRPPVILAGVKAVFQNPARGFYVVAEAASESAAANKPAAANRPAAAGELVAALLVTTEWSDWRNGEFWWIQSVYVLPEWRRRGLYRMLYEHVQQLAESAESVCGYRLYVERDNRAAQKTYAALGMGETAYKMYEQLRR